VRKALLSRMERGESVGPCLYLLQWFAEGDDTSLFAKFVDDPNVAIADLAYQFVRRERPAAGRASA